MSFENTFKSVSALVKNFEQNESYFLSQSYSKSAVRNDFIYKFIIQFLTQKTKTEGDKNYLGRKWERIDKEINQLVYQLYGLAEEEIKIVELEGKP